MPLNLVPRHMIESFSASSSSARLVSGQVIPGQTFTRVLFDTIDVGTFVDGKCIAAAGVYIVSVTVKIDMEVEQHSSELHILIDDPSTPRFFEIDSEVNVDAGTIILHGTESFYHYGGLDRGIGAYVDVDTANNRTILSGRISVEKIA